MKKILLVASLLIANSCMLPSSPALQKAWSTVSTALRDGSYNPRLTACMSLLGICTSVWVLKHYWNKYQLYRYKNSILDKFVADAQAPDNYTVARGAEETALNQYKKRNEQMKDDIRERYRYSCLALGIAGAAIATKGLHALLTAR